MKLSELYTTGTVAKKNNDGSSVAYVCTRPLSELYPDLDMEFDTTILLNNGSTSELLNTGAFGQTATAYNKNNTLYHGEPSSKIQYLGCCVVREWGFGTFINLSKHLISDSSWDSNFKLRFVINVISNENIGYNDYQPFNIDESSNVVYDFNSTYVVCNFGYKKTNTTRDISDHVQNPHELDGTGDDGNTGKRICYDDYSVMATEYNKYLADTADISKTNVGELAFAYLINGDYFLVRKPLYVPDSGYSHMGVTIDSNKYYLTIGGFTDFDNGISGFLPENDETKGAFAFMNSASGQFVSCTNYFVTSNCAEYVLNSCGLRWVTTNSISKAKDFRDNVRLGVMDTNGIINHKEWIIGESGIQASDNPNKDTSYDNIPDRPSSSSGDDIDEIGINDFPISDIGGLARYYAIDRFQLDELQGDFKNSTTGIPLDAGQFVIGLYQFPLDIPSFCTTSQEKIVLGKLETNAVGKKLLTVNRRVHLGEYFISANCGDNFLDYAPYTEIKLYIPYCGMVELPPNLFINSTLSVDMIIDIISGSCKGMVMCNNTFYTSISGSLMCSLPLSLEQCATKSLSIINSANSIMSGIIFGNKNYSALNTVTTLGEAMIENNNIAPSHISGNMDSVVNFYEPQFCILFMTYPQVNMGDIGKTHGKVCNYQDTLKNCHGYTVVNNPHLEIKCTNTEKDEITKLLEQGVILP